MIFMITKCIFSLLCAWLSALSCVEICVRERSCVLSVLSCNCLMEVPLWKVLVDVVEILLCEGGDVEQWLEPRNMSLSLHLIHYLSTLTLIYLALLYLLIYSYMLDIVYVLTLVFNQESY